MPCRCCNATKAPKGLHNHDDYHKDINILLSSAANIIKDRFQDPLYDEDSWKEEWIEAFRHHLYGCPEK